MGDQEESTSREKEINFLKKKQTHKARPSPLIFLVLYLYHFIIY